MRTLKRISDTVGFEETENDDYMTKLSRDAIVKLACSLGDSACISKMHDKLIVWLGNTVNNSMYVNFVNVYHY